MPYTVTAHESQARGALNYQIAYGDGHNDSNLTPAYCVAGSGAAANETWRLTHNYAAPGTYSVSVTVRVNCSPDRATASLTITVA